MSHLTCKRGSSRVTWYDVTLNWHESRQKHQWSRNTRFTIFSRNLPTTITLMCDQRSSGVANLLIFLCVFILQSQILQYQNIRKQSTFKILLLGPEDSESIVKCGFFYFLLLSSCRTFWLARGPDYHVVCSWWSRVGKIQWADDACE